MQTPGSKRKDEKDIVESFENLSYSFFGTRGELLATPRGADRLLGRYNTNIDYRFKPTPTSPAIMADGKVIANPKGKGEFYKGNILAAESQEVHSADDVLLNAEGLGADMDNTEVFFGMVRALGLDGTKKQK